MLNVRDGAAPRPPKDFENSETASAGASSRSRLQGPGCGLQRRNIDRVQRHGRRYAWRWATSAQHRVVAPWCRARGRRDQRCPSAERQSRRATPGRRAEKIKSTAWWSPPRSFPFVDLRVIPIPAAVQSGYSGALSATADDDILRPSTDRGRNLYREQRQIMLSRRCSSCAESRAGRVHRREMRLIHTSADVRALKLRRRF